MKQPFVRLCIGAFAVTLATGPWAMAQTISAPYTYPQATQQQCDDNTALWSLWQAIATPGTAPNQNPPLFPLAAIQAALAAVPLSQPLMDPSDLDAGEEYFSPNNSFYMQNWNYTAPQFYSGSTQTGYWQQSGAYAQAANDYENGNFQQSITEFDAIVNGGVSAPDYRAAAAYSAARADFRLGNFADGVMRISKILADPTLAQFWPQSWNLIDRTRAGGDIAPLAAAELLQGAALRQQPSAAICDNQPLQQLGLMAVDGISPTQGLGFEIPDYGWGGNADLVQPGIDYAMAHDPVVNAALLMYKSAATDRKFWGQTKNPLWALSLGSDGNIQDIPALNDAIANVRDSNNWPALTDRARAGVVWLLAMDEAQIWLKAGEQTNALAALSIPTATEKAAFDLPDPSGNITGQVSVPPDWVNQASDMAVNGGAQSLIVQAAVAADHKHSSALDQQPQWQAARQWAIDASTILHQPVADALKPVLVENMGELYEHPILRLTPNKLNGEISLTLLRTLYDDWTSTQLIEFSRRPYVAPADRQAMVGAAWIRAFALRDWHDVYAWLPDVRAAFPQLTPDTDRIQQAWLPTTKRHLALLMALKVPGFVAQPSDGRGMGLPAGTTWGTNVNANDVFAFDDWNPSDGNWWCPAAKNSFGVTVGLFDNAVGPSATLDQVITYPGLNEYTPDDDDLESDFNSAEMGLVPYAPVGRLGDEGAELAAVRATGSSTQRMAEDAVAWGKNSNWLERVTGGDEYLPEALHLAVRATRYACRRPADNGPWSRAAFAMLHDRFPESTWAAQTPYWFGDMTQVGQ